MTSDSKIHIIGEAGSNHNGREEKAIRLIEIGARAGVDSVKFQIIYPWGLYLPGEYQYGHYDIKEVIRIREEGMLSEETYQRLFQYSSKLGIPLSASVFDTKGLDLLLSHNPPYVKIASCDLNNIRFLKQVAEHEIKLVLSTGMSSLSDIEKSVSAIANTGKSDLVLMHCVSVYPAMLSQTNVSFVSTLKSEFGFPVGFSDHTQGSIAACLALSLGATWFEKHYTENKKQEGFDHKYALEEEELVRYVQDLRDTESALQPQKEKICDDELYTRKRARRSLYASRDLDSGHVIRDEDVLIVRPENIMNADEIDTIIGRTLTSAMKQYQAFSPKLITDKKN